MNRKSTMIKPQLDQEQGFILPFNTHTPRSEVPAQFGNIERTLPRPDMVQNVPFDRVPTDDSPRAPLWLKAFLAVVGVTLTCWFLTWENV